MANVTCVFCGLEKAPFSDEIIWEVEPSQYMMHMHESPVLPIPGAPSKLGFCTKNNCAQNLSIMLSYLHEKKKIRQLPSTSVTEKPWKNFSEVTNAVEFCNIKVANVSDPAIKSKVKEWITLANEALNEKSETVTEIFRFSKSSCVFCGLKKKSPFSNEIVWEVEPSQYQKQQADSIVLPIDGAPKSLGFCTENGCADCINLMLHFLWKFGRIPQKPAKASKRITNEALSLDDPEFLMSAMSAVEFCKTLAVYVSDSTIKSKVEEWVKLADETIKQLAKDWYNDYEIAQTNAGNVSLPDWHIIEKRKQVVENHITFKYHSQLFDFLRKFNYYNLSDNQSSFKTGLAFNDEVDEVLYIEDASLPYAKVYDILANFTSDYDYSDIIHSQICKIPAEDIIYFREIGSIEHLTKVSGGKMSGGGVNWNAARKGAFWLGPAGLIVGSQMGTEIKQEAIKTKVETKDSRQISLRYRNANGKIIEKFFPIDSYSFFMQAIPEKEFTLVTLELLKAAAALPIKTETATASSFDEIKKFKELLDCGIITEEEFVAKKKELLGL